MVDYKYIQYLKFVNTMKKSLISNDTTEQWKLYCSSIQGSHRRDFEAYHLLG
jgi:hypothetical protein